VLLSDAAGATACISSNRSWLAREMVVSDSAYFVVYVAEFWNSDSIRWKAESGAQNCSTAFSATMFTLRSKIPTQSVLVALSLLSLQKMFSERLQWQASLSLFNETSANSKTSWQMCYTLHKSITQRAETSTQVKGVPSCREPGSVVVSMEIPLTTIPIGGPNVSKSPVCSPVIMISSLRYCGPA
jgi:hypothetical protein